MEPSVTNEEVAKVIIFFILASIVWAIVFIFLPWVWSAYRRSSNWITHDWSTGSTCRLCGLTMEDDRAEEECPRKPIVQ